MPHTSTTTPSDEPLLARGRRAACLGAVLLVSMLAFEAMAVAAVMPAIADDLGGDGQYALAFGGLLAASVVGMVLAGWITTPGAATQRARPAWLRGARAASVLGMAVFGAGLLLAGMAPQMGVLVAGRVLQGLGSGLLSVALYVGMGQLVPPALHPRLFALFAAAWVLPGLVGPSLAAALATQWGWRAVFVGVALLVPVTAWMLIPALARLPQPAATGKASAGVLGWALLAALGAFALHAAGSFDSLLPTLALLAAGLALALWAAGRLLPAGSRVAARGLPAVIALRGLLAAGFGTAEAFVPLYLTRAQGWSLAQAGLALSIGAVAWSAGSTLQSRLKQEVLRQRVLRAGFALVALGIGIVALPALAGAPAPVLLLGWALAGLGIGLSFPMLSVLTLRLSPAAEQGRNASALQLCDALCSSAALAAAGLVFSHLGSSVAQGFAGVRVIAALLPALGALLAGRAAPVRAHADCSKAVVARTCATPQGDTP
ncbi:MFS transporter [uncultured Aquincola sp.]|uniref:MFS transporter n=1 Tax=uncultured Aquincola sp. TaxID=886556 RepID=UPI0032B272F4